MEENPRKLEEAPWPTRIQALAKVPWHLLALVLILALSAFLNLYQLTNEGYGNTYYAATVKNMLTSWHNFFFVSFDAGFVSVDKPPLGLWIQAASAWLFGFNGWSLLLPQALAGILSVGLLYYLVHRWFGPVAGLLAALTLALTPISVATDRNNNLESLLVLAVLLAAWAFMLAVETGRLRWLLVGALVVGLGFNIKMMEAFLILPAFYLLYLVAAPVGRWHRIIHLGLATVVLLTVSLSWVVAVDLTPADQRPYVGSSNFNTASDLSLGWNTVERFTGVDNDVGDRGPLRLLNQQLAGQIGWLLPLAVMGLAAASWQKRPRLPLGRQHQALVLWGMWFIPQVVFFSVAGDWDPHYLSMLAPGVAALVGMGMVALWNDYQSSGWRGWLLLLTLAGTASLQAHILADHDESWPPWLIPVIVGLCLIATGVLAVARLRSEPNVRSSSYLVGAATVGVLALLLAPSIWAASAVWYGAETRTPVAGPPVKPEESSYADPLLMDYLQVNQGDAKYLVAATKSDFARPIILNTDKPVISLGGFNGRDPVFSTERLAGLVDEGAVRFFLIEEGEDEPAFDTGKLSGLIDEVRRFFLIEEGEHKNKAPEWVRDNCEQVPQELWRSSTSKAVQLYDCGTRIR